MSKPAIDGRIARAIAALLDEDAAIVQELVGQMIDAHALGKDKSFYLYGAAARKGIAQLRNVLDELADGNYREAERLLGMNIDH